MIFKTTEKHFKLFKPECDYWIQAFGLIDWEIHYFHETDPDRNLAWESHNVTNRIASMGLSAEWKRPKPTKYMIRKVAFHEVCELLLARLDTEAKFRFATEDNVNETRHAVIRVLEKIVWEREHTNGGD